MRRLVGSLAVVVLAAGLGALAGPSEEEKIEAVVEQVVQAYGRADMETLGRYYAPDVSMVPSDYNPPLQGWRTVAARYQRAYAGLTGAEMTRENTYIRRRGKLAWAVYQWRFAAMSGGQTLAAQGHTTLILEKRGRNWLIVHNHTSAIGVPGAAPEENSESSSP